MDENPEAPSAPVPGAKAEAEPAPAPLFSAPLPPRDGARGIFIGPHGIRAGWSILIFAAILAVLGAASQAIGVLLAQYSKMNLQDVTPGIATLNEAGELALLAAATWAMSRIEGRPLLAYGYLGGARAVRFFSGLVWGFAAISALVLALWKLGYLALGGAGMGGEAALRYAAEWGLMFLLVGFFEESLLRGYLQFTLTRGLGFWWGALLLSFLFGFGHGHNPGESPVGLVSAGAVGLVFCLSLWYTGSLWWAVGFHAAWDWGESYFYGTADSGLLVQGHLLREHAAGPILWSGGTTGPEGSVLIFPLLAVIALLMALWWGRRVQSPFAGAGWRPLKSARENGIGSVRP